jgi:hypothetical protein
VATVNAARCGDHGVRLSPISGMLLEALLAAGSGPQRGWNRCEATGELIRCHPRHR